MQFQPIRRAKAIFWTAVIGGLAWFIWALVSTPADEESQVRVFDAVPAFQRPSPQPEPDQTTRSVPVTVQLDGAGPPAHAETRAEGLDTSPDLFAFAVAAANSSDPTRWAQGFTAAMECMAAREDRSMYERLMARAPLDDATVKASAAAALVMNRCRGFLNNDRIANEGLRKHLTTNIRTGDDYVVGLSGGPLTKRQFESVLLRNDYLTFGALWSEVQGPSLQIRNLKDTDPHALAFGIGYLLAQCDIGEDCSANGLRYAQFCVWQGHCDGSMENFFQKDLPASLKAEISIHREEIARAYRERNAAFFGMDSR